MGFPDCRITFCTFFEDREQFVYGEETYSEPTLFCVESGSFDYALGAGATYTLKRGEVVVCPPGVAFHRVMRETSAFCMIRLTTEAPMNFGDAPLVPRDLRRFFSDLSALRECRFRYDFRDGQSDEHHCRDIWYLLFPEPCREVDSIEAAFRDIGRRYTEPLSVTELALTAGYSTVHFINTFRRRYGLTPGAQITRLRLARARELLESTALTIREIAFAVGYSDEFYFSRRFHHHYGLSPRGFRTLGGWDPSVDSL